jgi:hypothetical protein
MIRVPSGQAIDWVVDFGPTYTGLGSGERTPSNGRSERRRTWPLPERR